MFCQSLYLLVAKAAGSRSLAITAFAVTVILAAACSKESNDLDAIASPDAIVDGTAYLEAATSFRNQISKWRAGEFSDKTFAPEALIQEVSNTFNILYCNPATDLTKHTVVFDSVRVPKADGQYVEANALELYEGVKDIVFNNSWYTNRASSAVRFVYISEPILKTTGTYVHVYANVGSTIESGVSDLAGRNGSQLWGDAVLDPGLQCATTTESDFFIQENQNTALSRKISVDAQGRATGRDDRKRNTRTILEGNALISLITSPRPGIADNETVLLPLQRFGRNNGPDFNSTVDCSFSSDFANAGQYLVHYDCNSNELCFSQAKSVQYVQDHTTLGDGIVFREWRAATGKHDPSIVRVGAFVDSFKGAGGPNAFVGRNHNAKFFYGRLVQLLPSAPDRDEPVMP